MKKRLTTIALVLLSLTLLAVGVELGSAAVMSIDPPKKAKLEVYYDSDLQLNILSEPNLMPNLMGMHDAIVGGVTYTGAVVTMAAGRVQINDGLPLGQSFECCLVGDMALMGGYTYYGFYRTADVDFKRLPKTTADAPITLDVVAATGAVAGNLSDGLTVHEDCTAALYLRSCTDGAGNPYYKSGQYQFHIVAVPD